MVTSENWIGYDRDECGGWKPPQGALFQPALGTSIMKYPAFWRLRERDLEFHIALDFSTYLPRPVSETPAKSEDDNTNIKSRRIKVWQEIKFGVIVVLWTGV